MKGKTETKTTNTRNSWLWMHAADAARPAGWVLIAFAELNLFPAVAAGAASAVGDHHGGDARIVALSVGWTLIVVLFLDALGQAWRGVRRLHRSYSVHCTRRDYPESMIPLGVSADDHFRAEYDPYSDAVIVTPRSALEGMPMACLIDGRLDHMPGQPGHACEGTVDSHAGAALVPGR